MNKTKFIPATPNDKALQNYVETIVWLLIDDKLSDKAKKIRRELVKLADEFTGRYYDLKAEMDAININENELFDMFRPDILKALNKNKKLKAMQFAAGFCGAINKNSERIQSALLDFIAPLKDMSDEKVGEILE